MNETLYMVLAFIAGLVLGTLFFGGLWLTVKKSIASKIPAIWFLGSFLFRVSIALAGFYYIASGNLQRLLFSLCGFIAARFVIIRLTKRHEQRRLQLKKGVSNED